MKKQKQNKKKQKSVQTSGAKSNRKFILLFGGLSAVFAALLLFSGIDYLFAREGRSATVLIACLSVLFTLFAVMINSIGLKTGKWLDALKLALAIEAAAELIMLPFLGKRIQAAEILFFGLTAAAAAVLFFLCRDREELPQIPLFLGILAAATGMLSLNTIAYPVFRNGLYNRLLIGGVLAMLFMLLSLHLTKLYYPGEQIDKAWLASFTAAFAVQAAAMLYGLYDGVSTSMLIYQGCILAATGGIAIALIIKIRKSQKAGQ